MTVYSDEIATALELITEAGQAVVWQQFPAAVDDADEPWEPSLPLPPIETPVTIVFVPTGYQDQQSLSLRSGTDVPAITVKGYMAGADLAQPTLGDRVIRDSVTLTPLQIDTLAPDGAPILHTIIFGG